MIDRTSISVAAWRRKDFSFDLLLEPYKEGGTPNEPVERNIGTLVDWLINKKKYPEDVAGAALLTLFLDLKRGRVFEGDGSHGSAGRELVKTLRFICDAHLNYKLKNKFYKHTAEKGMKLVSTFVAKESIRALPWFIKPVVFRWYGVLRMDFVNWRKRRKIRNRKKI